jgi:hypothetical protein
MQDSFYRNFLDEQDRIVAFVGGGGKTTLIQRLLKDCLSLNKKVIVIPLFPYIIPTNFKTCISDDIVPLKSKIKRALKKYPVVHVGKTLQKGILTGFGFSKIQRIFEEIESDHIFIEADLAKGRSISGYHHMPASLYLHIDRCINMIGADALNQKINMNWIAYLDEFWQSKKVLLPLDITNWILSLPQLKKMSDKEIAVTFFVNKVENMYIENLAIPLAKSIKLSSVERVLFGSIYNASLHLIR